MKKLHLPLPKLSTFTKRLVLLGAAVVIGLGLFTLAVVSQVRAERTQKAQEQARVVSEQKKLDELKGQLADAQKAQAAAESNAAASCNYIRATNAQRRVAVPPLCVIPKP